MENKTKSGFVSIIGRPNVGKSTLMNKIIGQKIAITSSKPQTTRTKISTVYTKGNTQMVFVDTPGLHKAKNKLGESMVSTAKRTFNESDVCLYLTEAEPFIGEQDENILSLLRTVSIPVILVITKTDKYEKEKVFKAIELFSKQMDFADVVPLSAKNGRNIDTLLEVIEKFIPEGPFYYDPDTLTDQPERQVVSEIIREKCLRCLGDEIPHGIAVVIDIFDFSKNTVYIEASIICERETHKGMIIGKGASKIKEIGTYARNDIEKLLDKKVNLKLFVKTKENWRDSEYLLKNFGFLAEERNE
ncbi:MAG: GTPase Era [Lachnospiraceae bacterium]|nr:GTPase Era [Lachnospiraceae bacterium]